MAFSSPVPFVYGELDPAAIEIGRRAAR